MTRYIILLVMLISLFACAGPRKDSAGIINSQRISQQEFIRSYQGHTANFQMANQRMPNSDEKKALFQETWKNVTTHVILKEHFRRYNITVTEQEVIDTLLASIPLYFKSNPALQLNGKFDPELYYQSVRYDSPINMSPIRRSYYEYYVPVQKLKEKLIDEDLRNRRKIADITEIASSLADFDLIIFDPQDMEPIFSDSEIEAYYRRNLDKFAMDPQYSLEYISLPVKPLDADFYYTQAVTDSIYEQIQAGKSLDTVIRERSEQLPGISLLEPGFVRVETLTDDVLAVLEPLPDNAHSRPIAIGRGYHIFQKLQRTKSMISYRVLQIPPILSPATVNAQFSQATGIISLARDIGLQATAEELDLEVSKHNDLSVADLWYSDKLIVERVNSLLLSHKRGDYLDPLYSPITGSWLIIRLSENRVNRVYPLADVKHLIIPELMEARKQRMVTQKASEWLAANPGAMPIEGRDNFQRFRQAGIDSQLAGKSLDIIYLTAVQRYRQKQAPQPSKLGDMQVIMIIREYYPEKGAKVDDATLKSLYTRQLDPDWFDQWMQTKHSNARIQIFVNP